MPVQFLNNYPPNQLENYIQHEGKTLYGELWVYQQFIDFNKNKFLPNETWFLQHDVSLPSHPKSKNKFEGQMDFLLLTKDGVLVIEVKGGIISLNNGCFYSSDQHGNSYEAQDPFRQVSEYKHSLIELMNKPDVFIYQAVVFPHTSFNFNETLKSSYDDILFSREDLKNCESDYSKNKRFFEFISKLGYKSRRSRLQKTNELFKKKRVSFTKEDVYQKYPLLQKKKLQRCKGWLFPTFKSYGFDSAVVNNEIILNENYDILRGLLRNRRIMVQGGPGTGKTVLATKFLAYKVINGQKGLFFCANRLIERRLKHIMFREYHFTDDNISFGIFTEHTRLDLEKEEIDFIVFDEAQEYFKVLIEFLDLVNCSHRNIQVLILYDTDQTIVSQFENLSFYEEYILDANNYAHFKFNNTYRCIQNPYILEIALSVLKNKYSKVLKRNKEHIIEVESDVKLIEHIYRNIIGDKQFTSSEKVILVTTDVLQKIQQKVFNVLSEHIEELTSDNICVSSSKIKFTTPLKYRGLENKAVYILTSRLNNRNQTQLYVGITRAINQIKIIQWLF